MTSRQDELQQLQCKCYLPSARTCPAPARATGIGTTTSTSGRKAMHANAPRFAGSDSANHPSAKLLLTLGRIAQSTREQHPVAAAYDATTTVLSLTQRGSTPFGVTKASFDPIAAVLVVAVQTLLRWHQTGRLRLRG